MDINRLLGLPGRIEPPKGSYMWAVFACVLTTVIATPLREVLDLTNIVMLFLLTVLLVAARFGRGPAVLAAFLSVALFDVFFVPPRFSFTVHDAQYLVTFAVMLAVALVTGQLTASLRQQAVVASLREQRTQALYEMARGLAGAPSVKQVTDIVRQLVQHGFGLDVVLLLLDTTGELKPVSDSENPPQVDQQFVYMAFDQAEPVEDAFSGYGYGSGYFPLKAPMRVRGVIVFVPGKPNPGAVQELKPFLATVASLVAIAVERLHYVDVAHNTQMQIVSERLRSSILSALSHDLRTPLTALVGLADSLALTKPPLPAVALETAEAIHEQAVRLSNLVGNLLDMARLHAGEVRLRKEWQVLEEVIGASIQLLGSSLATHQIRVSLAKDIPLLEYDAVLIERVFCNLLENAAKYAPNGSVIEIVARGKDGNVEVSVCDQGPGFPPDKQHELFDMFVRGVPESATPGVGLGLAICRAILEAHNGTISASNRPEGGACVTFTLPMGTPPVIEEEVDDGNGKGWP
jgi:two-component system, OmpR family, sensor histidine kinase KdpD